MMRFGQNGAVMTWVILGVGGGLAMLLALSQVSCSKKPDAVAKNQAKELRIATQPAPQYSPIFIAKQNHWLEDELAPLGVTVKWTSFLAGPPENESFAAGLQDLGVMGDTPVIVARSNGLDTRIIGVAAVGPKVLALVAPKDSPIKTPADLKGKKVAVTKGSYAHHLLYILLKNAGLTVDDISLIHLSPPDLVSAFNHGDVDAAVTWEPFLSRIEVGGARRIADGTGIKKGELVIFAINDFATKNPDLVQRVLKAYQRGYEFIKAHPEESAKLLSEEVKLPPEQVLALLPLLTFDPALGADDIQELKATEEFLRTSGLSKDPVDINAFVDTTYLKAAGLLK